MKTTKITDQIYKLLRSKGLTHNGACGLLGNLYSESGCEPQRVEELLIQRYDEDFKGKYSKYKDINGGYKRPVNTYDNMVFNDTLYLERYKKGIITEDEFLSPRGYDGKHQYGFGLVQWTTKARKQGLLDLCKKKGTSIDDLETQLEYLIYELVNKFATVYKTLINDEKTLKECSDIVLTKFEAPADAMSQSATRLKYAEFYADAYKEAPTPAPEPTPTPEPKKITSDKQITICGHGSGNPSLKNLNTYSTSRYEQIAGNGKRKGIVAVRRFKALTDEGRKKFHDKYKTILGRNLYSQNLRDYCYRAYNGKYYSDCSSSGCLTLAAIGYDCPSLNTAGIYQNSRFETVPVEIKNGHIMNPEILRVGDAILFVGTDPLRPLQIGHVEYVYEIDGEVEPQKEGYMFTVEDVYKGCKDSYSVYLLSEIFRARGYLNIDRTPQTLTKHCDDDLDATIRYYQKQRAKDGVYLGTGTGTKHVPDGVCGEKTWKDLLAL